ncbi:TrbI F-type domain-containing protein [Chromobacterium sp. IIBBL 290-4]|uniref:TrbI F-type domain-containing protein n=1 Tax=Chromobacterium sp. IIBBL 290-4 TaxID=2953890 RepID=UPI0020B7E4C5|nr:TrbI F-type domain-containing protein [Chromobacterium sp. IIBBL 290-4]UTH74236.1 type-F conjugative transfer system protein TrbI [Chromobacterium sp. IIBBL 290-4]
MDKPSRSSSGIILPAGLETNAPPIASSDAPRVNPQGYITRFGAVMLCLLTAGASLAGGYMLNALFSTAPSVVVVDDEQLVQAKIQSMIVAKMTPTQAQAETQQFVGRLAAVMKSYAEHGYVVLRARDVLSAPVGSNQTTELARQLGVTLLTSVETVSGGKMPLPIRNGVQELGVGVESGMRQQWSTAPSSGLGGESASAPLHDPSSENYDPADPYGLKSR